MDSQFSLEEIALTIKQAQEFVARRVINREEVIEQAFVHFLQASTYFFKVEQVLVNHYWLNSYLHA